MRERKSMLGLEEENSFFDKLGNFLSALCLGPLLGLLLFAGIYQLQQPWRALVIYLCQLLAVFWVLLLVYIWWRPPWLRKHYLSAERKAVLIVRIVGTICLLVFGLAMLIGWVREMLL